MLVSCIQHPQTFSSPSSNPLCDSHCFQFSLGRFMKKFRIPFDSRFLFFSFIFSSLLLAFASSLPDSLRSFLLPLTSFQPFFSLKLRQLFLSPLSVFHSHKDGQFRCLNHSPHGLSCLLDASFSVRAALQLIFLGVSL